MCFKVFGFKIEPVLDCAGPVLSKNLTSLCDGDLGYHEIVHFSLLQLLCKNAISNMKGTHGDGEQPLLQHSTGDCSISQPTSAMPADLGRSTEVSANLVGLCNPCAHKQR